MLHYSKNKGFAVSVLALALSACAGTHSPEIQETINDRSFVKEDYDTQIKKYKPVREEIGQVKSGYAYHDINNYTIIPKDRRMLPDVFNSQLIKLTTKDGHAYTLDEFASLVYKTFKVDIDTTSSELNFLAKNSDVTKKNSGFQLANLEVDSTGKQSASKKESKVDIPREDLKLAPINFEGNLRGLLDYIATSNGIKWKYNQENNKVYLYVLETKTFKIDGFQNDTDFNSQISSASSQNSESTSSNNNSTLSTKAKLEAWKDIQETVKNLLSEDDGKASFDLKHGIVTVTDRENNLVKIDSYIKELNKASTTEIVVDFRVIKFSYSEGDDHRINQSYINNNLQNHFFGKFDLGFGSGAMSPDISGNLSSFQQLLGGNYLSIVNDSQQYLLGFLNKIGTAKVAYQSQSTILNNQMKLLQKQKKEEYVSSITRQATTSTNGLDSIQTENDFLIDGVQVFLRPRITSDNKILISYSISDDTALGLKDAGSGTALEGIKLKTQDSLNLGGTNTLRNGVPKVIDYNVISKDDVQSQGTLSHLLWFLGGNESKTSETNVIIITATAYYNN
jgi:type IVB pilus formation R64 PilN family outer membrane protein